jgi:hypothetical protein
MFDLPGTCAMGGGVKGDGGNIPISFRRIFVWFFRDDKT